MTDKLEMPSLEESQKPELRMVIIPLELPKLLWWTFDMSEKTSGTPTVETLTHLLRQAVLKETLIALLKSMKEKI